MNSPVARTTSDTARLINGAPGFAVGWQERLVVSTPAAGAQLKYTVDGRYYERILSVRFLFTASAVVGNRYVNMQVVDVSGNIITSVPAGYGIPANGVINVSLTVGGPAYATGGPSNASGFIPDLLIPPGYSFISAVNGLDAGDTFTGISLLVQRFPNDAVQISTAS